MRRHITLVNSRAKAAEVYPDKLCREIVKGLVEQMEALILPLKNQLEVQAAELCRVNVLLKQQSERLLELESQAQDTRKEQSRPA